MSRSREASYHHGDLKRALVEAALEIIEAEGPGALTFRKLAEMLKVSHAAPLAHFPDRASLDAAIAARGFQRLESQLASRAAAPAALSAFSFEAQSTRVATRLVAMSLAYVRFAIEHAGLYRAMHTPELAERRQSAEPGFRELFREKAQVVKRFVDLVEDGQRAGEFRRGVPPEQLARLFLGLAEGLSNQYILEKPGSASDQLKDAEQLIELLVESIVSQPGS